MPLSPGKLLGFLPALAVLIGCRAGETSRVTLPSQFTIDQDPLVVHSDFPLSKDDRLVAELAAGRGNLEKMLDLSIPKETIHIYLFEHPDQFREYRRLYHPDFPDRRAFFFPTKTHLVVFAQWGDHVAEDLRHEVTHGYLHAAVPNLPLWLDEGLAKYCEAPRGRHGINRPYLEQLVRRITQTTWRPNLPRLEQWDPTQDMSQQDYAESWAWVHLLLESGPECQGVLREYLKAIRRDASAGPISSRLARVVGAPERALLDHLHKLAASDGNRS